MTEQTTYPKFEELSDDEKKRYKMFPPRHLEGCTVERGGVNYEPSASESMCTCGAYEIKREQGWAL